MALLKTNRHCLKLFPTGCRILSCCFSSRITVQPPYWHKIFPDKIIRNFDEMPTVGPVIEEYKNFKIHESYHRWVKDVGHVVKELFPDGSCCVHVYYKDDFKAVYQNDGGHPLRKSHGIIAKYRQDRPLIYGNVGLGPGLGAEWARLRKMLPSGVGGKDYLPFRYDLEGITNDFIELILRKLDKNGEVELLPLLFRWAFESIGFVTLNRHLGSLRFDGQEEVNNLIEAAHLTNEIVFLSNVCDFEKQYERLVPIQDYFASKVIEYVQDTINLHLYGPCIVVNLSEAGFDVKLISTLIMDLFQGATATVSKCIV
ncbi:hypothetical protein TNCT_314741 [Trichonephila clavata]|uniref:Uncharacterized protein n=1 Tax=Trichonephila clavata TaxID=2740835 RepID=A0A8X6LFZ9_TRICU|nr:hypothetical protein TNCT_314741 [Trichonephila clavata]